MDAQLFNSSWHDTLVPISKFSSKFLMSISLLMFCIFYVFTENHPLLGYTTSHRTSCIVVSSKVEIPNARKIGERSPAGKTNERLFNFEENALHGQRGARE